MIETLGIHAIQQHVNSLTSFLYLQLESIHHSNGKPVVEIYGKHHLHDSLQQGGILAFNVLKSNGRYLGYYRVQQDSLQKNIHLRTGCHCNPGACRKYLHQPVDVYERYERGNMIIGRVLEEKQTCSDSFDSYRGLPLGAGSCCEML